ncbi:MAG: GtrA family protein [Patescibacteria group bacterium]
MLLIDNLYFRIKRYFLAHFPNLMAYLHRNKSAAKFVLSGCLTGGLDLFFLYIFHGIMHIGIIKATSMSFVICFLLSFFLQKIWTFRNRSNDRVLRQMLMYFAVGFMNLNFNGFLMHILVIRFGVWYLLSQLLVNFTLGAGNYIFSKFIIFRKKNEIRG